MIGFGNKVAGKVRDIYDKGLSLILITTDRQSAFDRDVAFYNDNRRTTP